MPQKSISITLFVLINIYLSFINVDLALRGVLEQCAGIDRVVCAYNVACQYCVNVKERMAAEFPDLDVSFIEFVIGKMHIQGHVDRCHWCFNIHWLKSVGRLDGEAAERLWSECNHAAGCTKQMAPGGRDDYIDGMFGHWNLRKQVNLGTYLFKYKLKKI